MYKYIKAIWSGSCALKGWYTQSIITAEQVLTSKHLSGHILYRGDIILAEKTGGLAALHSKSVRTKIVGR